MGTRASHESQRRVAAILLAAVLLLALGGCEFFTATAFPEYVSSISASQSVSSWLNPERDEYWLTASVDVAENRLFLSVDKSADGELVVFDSDLDVVENYTRSELDSTVTDTGSFGRRAGYSGTLQPIVGGYIFDFGSGGGSLEPLLGVNGLTGLILDPFLEAAGRYEESDPDGFDTIRTYVFQIDNGTQQMLAEEYSPIWSSTSANSVPLGGGGSSYHIVEVLSIFEGTTPDSFLLFLIGEQEEDRIHVFFVSYQDFPPYGGVTSMLESAGGTSFFEAYAGDVGDLGNHIVIEDADPYTGFLTSAGVIVRGASDDELRLHGFDGRELDTFSMEGFRDAAVAFPFEGTGFYVLDEQREELYRLTNFWE